jgi:hypothetical protein
MAALFVPIKHVLLMRRDRGCLCAFVRENGMFSHVMIGSNDIARPKKFYDALFGALGGKPGRRTPRGG